MECACGSTRFVARAGLLFQQSVGPGGDAVGLHDFLACLALPVFDAGIAREEEGEGPHYQGDEGQGGPAHGGPAEPICIRLRHVGG